MNRCLAKFLVVITLTISAFSINANATDNLFIEIEKHSKLNWTVSYQSHKPINAVMFANSPDNSRLNRWQPISSAFSINYINSKEIVTRKDGKNFTFIKFQLTPSYIHLPKSYAPFSPFSNDAMLVHSGRFFACPNICSGNENLWAIAVKAPLQDTILVDGKAYIGKTSWWDKNDGKKIYIGQQNSDHNSNYISVVDPKLTQTVGKQLHTILPSMMSLLEESYGAPLYKPMLFASFGETTDGSFGRQGGTLPNQIFMHWFGDASYPAQNTAETLWFFAHEAAHMYQNMTGKAVKPVDNWIHEGHAEMMAKKIMLSLFPQYQRFVQNKTKQAKIKCLEIIADSSLPKQIEEGKYQTLYDCGLYIYNTIEMEYQKDDGTETLWLEFMKQARKGEPIDSQQLLSLAERKYSLSKKNADIFRTLMGIK